MKQILSVSLIILTCVIAACNKEEDKMILPKIEFKTSAGYTYQDTAVTKGSTLVAGIIAEKTEDKDVLKTFDVSVSYNGGAASSVHNELLTGSEGDYFSTDYTIVTKDEPGTEKWIFTVINRDGLINSVSFTVTVQ